MRSILCVVIGGFVVFNIYWMVVHSGVVLPERDAILRFPTQTNSYVAYASRLWAMHEFTSGAQELILARDQTSSNVLGASISPLTLLTEWMRKQTEYKQAIVHWKQVVIEKPDYRDAYLTLAVLSYNTGQFDAVQPYLDQALALDPNYQLTRKLQEELK